MRVLLKDREGTEREYRRLFHAAEFRSVRILSTHSPFGAMEAPRTRRRGPERLVGVSSTHDVAPDRMPGTAEGSVGELHQRPQPLRTAWL